MKKIKIGDYLYNYCGECSHRRDKTKDRNSVCKYQVIDMISDPSKKKPTLLIQKVEKRDGDKPKDRCWFSDVGLHYNIVQSPE